MARVLVRMTTDSERYRNLTRAGYFSAFVALGLSHASLGPTLTDLATGVGVAITQISYVFTARGLGYLVGSVAGGILYDLVRGHPVMGGMLVLISLFLFATPLASALWLLVAFIFLLGMFEGAVDVGGNTLLVWVYRDEVAPHMNALHFFFGIGAFLSPIIIAQARLATGGIQWAYWILAVLMLPVAAFVFRLRSPRAPAKDAVAEDGSADHAPALGRDLRMVALVALFFFLYVGAEGSFGGWIATYAETTGVGDATTAAYLTSAFWGAITLGRLLSIPIAKRFTPRQVLFGDLVACLVSVAILLLWPGARVATWVGTLGAGLAMASIFPTTLSFAERNMTITGTITSLFFIGGSLGGMTLPAMIGQLFERVGPRVTTVAIMGAVVLDLLVFGLMLLHTWAKAKKAANGVL